MPDKAFIEGRRTKINFYGNIKKYIPIATIISQQQSCS